MADPIKVEFKLPNANVGCCIQCKKEAMVTAIIEDTVQNGLCYEHFESFANELNDKGIINNSKKILDYFEKQKVQKSRKEKSWCLSLSKY